VLLSKLIHINPAVRPTAEKVRVSLRSLIVSDDRLRSHSYRYTETEKVADAQASRSPANRGPAGVVGGLGKAVAKFTGRVLPLVNPETIIPRREQVEVSQVWRSS
jgi:hypothetical protein